VKKSKTGWVVKIIELLGWYMNFPKVATQLYRNPSIIFNPLGSFYAKTV